MTLAPAAAAAAASTDNKLASKCSSRPSRVNRTRHRATTVARTIAPPRCIYSKMYPSRDAMAGVGPVNIMMSMVEPCSPLRRGSPIAEEPRHALSQSRYCQLLQKNRQFIYSTQGAIKGSMSPKLSKFDLTSDEGYVANLANVSVWL